MNDKKENKTPVIALLGQPNSGKSTIFNMITGSHQHVENWPGKTVEQKEGGFKWNGQQMVLADLPGSYSLSAGSDEEIITKDYISTGNADLVLVMADASQLKRSLYMLADFVGTPVPAILILNMMDVAKDQGISINTKLLSEKLGIPVVPMSAIQKKDYSLLYETIERSLVSQNIIKENALTSAEEKMNYIDLLLTDVLTTSKTAQRAFTNFYKVALSPVKGKQLGTASPRDCNVMGCSVCGYIVRSSYDCHRPIWQQWRLFRHPIHLSFHVFDDVGSL